MILLNWSVLDRWTWSQNVYFIRIHHLCFVHMRTLKSNLTILLLNTPTPTVITAIYLTHLILRRFFSTFVLRFFIFILTIIFVFHFHLQKTGQNFGKIIFGCNCPWTQLNIEMREKFTSSFNSSFDWSVSSTGAWGFGGSCLLSSFWISAGFFSSTWFPSVLSLFLSLMTSSPERNFW